MSDTIRDALPRYEELLKLPDNLVGEIISNELFASPRPASPPAHTSSLLSSELIGPFHRGRGGPGGWWILHEPELHLGSDVLVPDLAGWRREHMPQMPSVAAFDLRPDWVCEVVSPATAQLDRVRKMPVYAQHGVMHLWLADPLARVLEVYRLADRRWTLVLTAGGNELVRAEPFEAIELELAALWLD